MIAILPGSRKSEIYHHSKPLSDFINIYKKQNPDVEIILALNKESDLLGELKLLSKKISIIYDSTQKVLASCDMAVVASGTATLEAAILAKPMVVIYKSNKLSNFILSNFFLKTKFISLPNILSQEKIVFELRQNQVSGKEISEKVELTLKNKEVISEKLSLIRDSLLVSDSNKFSIALKRNSRKMKKYLVGADEVGRGCLFGPVVAAAVILGNNNNFELKDSKKLSEKKRIILLSEIERNAIKISIGKASVKEIDSLNIKEASLLAMKRAILGLKVKNIEIIVDGIDIPKINYPCKAIIKADDKIPEVMAASIVAKVHRDNLMIDF